MTEKEIKEKIKRIESHNNKLEKELITNSKAISKLNIKLCAFEEEKAKKFFNTFKVGDKFVYINKEINYHYTIMEVYELLKIEDTKTTFRRYRVFASDGEFKTMIEIVRNNKIDFDITKLLKYKKISDNKFKEKILPIILNPDIAEETIKEWKK